MQKKLVNKYYIILYKAVACSADDGRLVQMPHMCMRITDEVKSMKRDVHTKNC